MQKDVICRFIFLNLVVDEEKVVNFELKEPFKALLAERKQRTFSGSGHALQIVKPISPNLETLFADVKTFSVRIMELAAA